MSEKEILAEWNKFRQITTDKISHNDTMTKKQMNDAAYKGVWKCHGYSLEPDAECPKCGRGMFK